LYLYYFSRVSKKRPAEKRMKFIIPPFGKISIPKLSIPFFSGTKAKFKPQNVSEPPIPAQGGQVSGLRPDFVPNLPTDPDKFMRNQLVALNHLSNNNELISYAVGNAVRSANTEFEIIFPDKTSARQRKLMLEFITKHSEYWFENGIHGLRRAILRGIFVQGAVAIEPVLAKNRRYLERVYFVDNQYIYVVPQADGTNLIEQNTGAHRVLYGKSFLYKGLDYDGVSPYPTPLLLPAIKNAILQDKMKDSFSTMINYLGMLGAVLVSLKQPKKGAREKTEDYKKRLKTSLSEQYEAFSKGMAGGLTITFDEMVKMDVVGNNINTQNAVNLSQIITQWLSTSVQTNPDLVGGNQSSTKAFGEVALTQELLKARDPQLVMDSILSRLILTHLYAGGSA